MAFRAQANDSTVTAENAGTKPLIANRASAGAWEEFRFVQNSDCTVSLLANADGRYVTAEGAGTQPLIARGTSIGDWEAYAIIAD